MLKLGLVMVKTKINKIFYGRIWKLIDLETGEVLADGNNNIQKYLSKIDGRYTLKLIL